MFVNISLTDSIFIFQSADYFCFHLFSYVAAARALKDIPDMSAEDVAKKAMVIASSMCVHTNDCYVTKTIDEETEDGKDKE